MSRQSGFWCCIASVAFWIFLLGPVSVWGQDSKAFQFELIPETFSRSGPAVWSLAVSPDQKWIAVGSEPGRILLRDTLDKQAGHVLEGHAGLISALAFSPSSEVLASAGVDGKVLLWDIESGRLERELPGHENWITCLAFSPDGRLLASGGYDKTVRLWEAETGRAVRSLADHAGTVRTLAFSPDGKTLASAGDDGVVQFWNPETGEAAKPLSLEAGSLRAVAYSPDGKKLLIAPEDEKVRIWDVGSRGIEREFSAVAPGEPDTTPTSAVYCPDGETVIVSTRGGRARVWAVETGTLLQSLNGHDDSVAGLAIAPDGKTLYTAGLDGKVLAWPALLPLEPPLARLPIVSGDVWALALSPDGKTLAAGGRGGFVEIWDLTAGRRLRVLEDFGGTIDCLEFSPDGRFVAAAGWRSENFLAWSTETGEVVHSLVLKIEPGLENDVRTFAISPDGQTLAVGHAKHPAVSLYSLPERKKTGELTGHQLSIYDVAFSPDGTQIASASGEWTERKPGRVMIHNVLTGSKLAQFDDHTHAVRSLTFSADGSKLFSVSQDGVLKIYETSALRESATLKNGLDARPVAATSDGRRVAVGLQNGNINLWDLARRSVDHRLEGTDDLFSLRFSPDGSLLFGADGNSFVQIWKISPKKNSLAETVQRWVNRPASAESPREIPSKETP